MSRLALPLALVCSVLVAPEVADACGNEVERVVDTTNETVRSAELHLARGQYKKAIGALHEEFGDRLLAFDRDAHLHERAQRVLAVAAVRSKGEIGLGKDLGGKTDAQKRAAIAWAALILRTRHTPNSTPSETSDLAEALAMQASGRAEAHRLLKKLGDDDLMPGAEGWALLAELTKERGDADASKNAVERCKQLRSKVVKCEVAENS